MESTDKNFVPRWNLDSIYSSLQSKEYSAALEEFKAQIENTEGLLKTADRFTRESNENFDFAAWLAAYLKNYNELIANERTLAAYAYIIYSTDTTSTQYLNNLSYIEKLGIQTRQQYLKFSTLLLSHSSSLNEFFTRFPEFAEYKYLLEETIEETKHQMTAAEENLASDMTRTGGSAWGQLQEQIISNLHDQNGKTFNELRNDAFSSDANLRKNSWQTEKLLLEQNQIALAASLNNLKGETVTLNKRRHWENALDRSRASSRIQKATLDALISSIEDSLPIWREYFKAKALLLRKTKATASKTAGSPGHEGIAFYDLFAPLEFPQEKNSGNDSASLLSKKWSFDQARDYVLKEYKSFSQDMYAFAKNAFDSGWIDAEIRSGKVGGAYDEDFPKNHQSRILTNFTGTFSDIITLAHELGHAYHFSCMKGKPALFFDYPMTLAETASTFAETIVKQDMIQQAEGSDKIKIIDLDLQDTSQVLVDILCRFYFEQSVFEEREKGELNANDFCRLMLAAQEKTYGCGLNEERHEYMWAVKSHYYSTDFDFYNYPYAFGQLFAAGLYARSKKEGPAFAKTYASLLADTGSMSCEDLCKKAGFDITTKDFWKTSIQMYAKEVEEFKAFAENL
ncbi:MAG: M3 family oligoendopeptidase [Treponema sp.]|nr:M3 family oligoendopeptidase [Treponema sp.]MBQ4024374.1 M3 family oligoendopeptidase [Treponema sp.]MBR4385634.1 M3 family oligoendopeptidase [Treponema sp.]